MFGVDGTAGRQGHLCPPSVGGVLGVGGVAGVFGVDGTVGSQGDLGPP